MIINSNKHSYLKQKNNFFLLFSLFPFLFSLACTFDYGESASSEQELPDLIMRNVEYVRVRSADPTARVQAEIAERYEDLGVMRLYNFSFEQFGKTVSDVNSYGRAGSAEVNIDTNDISMNDGVRLEVESEDIVIETQQLEWLDKQREFFSGNNTEVTIYRENGTTFSGMGLSANARTRTWNFSGQVSGTFIQDEDEEEEEDEEPADPEPAPYFEPEPDFEPEPFFEPEPDFTEDE